MSPRSRFAALLLTLACVPAVAHGGDGGGLFDTTVSFSFADDNALKDAGETRQNSPTGFFGQSPDASFSRVEDPAYEGTTSMLRIASSGTIGRWMPGGEVRIRFAVDTSGKYALSDYGSNLSLRYLFGETASLGLRAFPVDTNRIRLGRTWDVTWGGSDTFPRNFRSGLVPGFKLDLDTELVDVFAAMKAALIRSPSEGILDNPGGNTTQLVERAYYAALLGVGVDIPRTGLRLDLQGAFFQKGTSTRDSVLGEPILAGGGTAIVSWKHGGPVGNRLDLDLYFQDPDLHPLRGDSYEGRLGVQLSAEYSHLVQVLEDPDRPASTKLEQARAAALSAGFRFRGLRTHLNLIFRDLSFIVFNVPGVVPYQALPTASEVQPEIFGVLSVDYFFAKVGLTPALSVGVLRPATYRPTMQGSTLTGPYAAEVEKGIHTIVIKGSNAYDWQMLPVGENEWPVFLARVDLKWNLGDSFAMIGEVSYRYDGNLAQVFLTEQGHAVLRFDDPHILSYGLVAEYQF
ncbi:MAG: hypothetical protein FJ098_06440 [Deltaproteobacteria bacterium]|nr:hypothetical protein [Deltaproteobacteria bacterium]